ncbi:hypothetical protein ACLOJK_024336 [Asimina triloba]
MMGSSSKQICYLLQKSAASMLSNPSVPKQRPWKNRAASPNPSSSNNLGHFHPEAARRRHGWVSDSRPTTHRSISSNGLGHLEPSRWPTSSPESHVWPTSSAIHDQCLQSIQASISTSSVFNRPGLHHQIAGRSKLDCKIQTSQWSSSQQQYNSIG